MSKLLLARQLARTNSISLGNFSNKFGTLTNKIIGWPGFQWLFCSVRSSLHYCLLSNLSYTLVLLVKLYWGTRLLNFQKHISKTNLFSFLERSVCNLSWEKESQLIKDWSPSVSQVQPPGSLGAIFYLGRGDFLAGCQFLSGLLHFISRFVVVFSEKPNLFCKSKENFTWVLFLVL